jgi:hypothetical protein
MRFWSSRSVRVKEWRMEVSNEHLNRVKQKALTEGRKLLWIFLYLWVLLGLFAVHKSVVLNEQNLFFHQGFAVINAFLLAKVMFTAEMFHVADNLKDKPLIYPIVFKSTAFSILLIGFYIIEEMIMGKWHGKTFSDSIPVIGGGSLEGILVVGIIVFVVLMPFFALREFGRVIGDDKLYELFFVRRTKYVPPHSVE